MEYKRADRVADQLQREIADLLLRRVKDPRVSGLTVTGAEVTPDLRHARVFYCLMGTASEDAKMNASKGLEKVKGFIRQQLGKRLHLRYLPELEFRYDGSFDYGVKMDQILKGLQQDE